MENTILLPVRGTVPNYGEGVEQQPMMTSAGEQLVAQGLPALASIVAAGDSWIARTTALAPVIAIPSTAALFALYNGEAQKSLIIDSAFLVVVVVTAAVQGHGLLANISTAKSTSAPSGTALTPLPMLAGRTFSGAEQALHTATLTAAAGGAATNWFPIGSGTVPSNTLQIGSCIEVPLGNIIIPPGGIFALTALAGAATAASVHVGCRWHKRILPGVS